MIKIDGSQAGGQLLRIAVALSALTKESFKITNIRGARPEPGLKAQHIEGVKAVAKLCDAKTKGLKTGSKELEFHPNKLEEKNLEIKISTSGSIGLILQALLILTPHLKKEIKIKFEGGGTWGKWAPSVAYMEKVLLPLLDYECVLDVVREGFYPEGAAVVEATLKPMKIKYLDLKERTEIKTVDIVSVASKSLERSKVAERQALAAQKLLDQKLYKTPFVEIDYSETPSTGSGILVLIRTANSYIGADLTGEKGKTSEDIGNNVVKDLIKEYSNGVVDRHAADMLLPYMAFAGRGEIVASEMTHHIETSIDIIKKFLPVKFILEGNMISVKRH